jgi:hypothetical protein
MLRFAQHDTDEVSVLRRSLLMRVNDAEMWAPDELDTAFRENPVSNLNRATHYDVRP